MNTSDIIKLPEQVSAKIAIAESTGCWNWLGYISKNGYGQMTYQKITKKAHRLVYELLVGEIPAGLQIDHLCRNRKCVNPAHLEPVTQRENILRGASPTAKNKSKTHCLHGHPLDGENLLISSGGRRVCRECHRKQNKQWKQKQEKVGQVSCERHGCAKLTNDDVLTIRSSDKSNSELAGFYGVDKGTIARIKRRGSWKNI